MFAFAIYDARARRLVLARDRFGIKPLFVAESAARLSLRARSRRSSPRARSRPSSTDRRATTSSASGTSRSPPPGSRTSACCRRARRRCSMRPARHAWRRSAFAPCRGRAARGGRRRHRSAPGRGGGSAVDRGRARGRAAQRRGSTRRSIVAAYARTRKARPKTFTVTFPERPTTRATWRRGRAALRDRSPCDPHHGGGARAGGDLLAARALRSAVRGHQPVRRSCGEPGDSRARDHLHALGRRW